MNIVCLPGESREVTAMVATIAALDDLVKEGLVDGGKYRLSSAGRDQARILKELGFEFNDGEVEACMAFLQSDDAT